MIENISSILTTIGFPPSTHPFIFLAILIILGFISIALYLGKPLRRIRENVLVIITHLSTANRGKLDTNLIKQMSPLQIQPAGQKVLDDSTFTKIFNENKNKFFATIDEKNPQTKLEVENYSIYSFSDIFIKDEALNPVKAYLYQNPSIRETFPTLAGVYIRDEYLRCHPEITQ